MTPTYEQQWQKITEAYIKDEILPMDSKFCFCGTLCDNEIEWHYDTRNRKHNNFSGYTGSEYVRMERALLDPIAEACGTYDRWHHRYEASLFKGMVAALEVLRQIHEAKGDPTAKEIKLEKRVLQTA